MVDTVEGIPLRICHDQYDRNRNGYLSIGRPGREGQVAARWVKFAINNAWGRHEFVENDVKHVPIYLHELARL